MITLIHGEDTLNSYKKLSEIINSYKSSGVEVNIKDVTDLDATSLRQELTPLNLFGSTQCLVIKNLLSGTKSKVKETLIDIVKDNHEADIVLYEPKKLSETVLKDFKSAKIETFSINPVIFKFLDILHPGNTRVIVLSWNKLLDLGHEPEYVFAMLVRQIRLLIQAKSGPSYLKLAPFQKRQITSQATYFTLNHLLDLHHSLYEIDKKIKTGLTPLPLTQLLTQFFYNI